MSKEAIKLIKHCLSTKNPFLDLGNSRLTNNDVANGTEIDRLLSQCTHLEMLILRVRSRPLEKIEIEDRSSNGGNNKSYVHPPALEKLVNLSALLFAANPEDGFGITDMKFVSFLPKLRILNLRNNRITKIVGLEKLNALNKLDLSYNQITEIEGLQTLSALHDLNLGINQINKIEGLEKLNALNRLNLSYNQITKIEGLQTLSALHDLNLSNNQISKIEGLKKLNALNQLNLSYNQITKIEGLEKLTVLNDIVLSSNSITKIEGLNTLTVLNKLDVSFNKITKIEGLETLKILGSLFLRENKITKIEGLDVLQNRNDLHLNLSRNPLDKKYPFKLMYGEDHFPFIRDYLLRQKEAEKLPVHYPIKVLVLGNHASGKSSLVNCITSTEKTGSTHILRIENYFINKPAAKEQPLPDAIFYDFGGQDFYHGLYQAFISKGGLQLILFTTRTDSNYPDKDNTGYDIVHFNRYYWLGQKKYKGNLDPYVMVQTYLDMEDGAEAAPIDYKLYEGYKRGFFLSLKGKLSENQKRDEVEYKAGNDNFTAYFKSLLEKIQAAQDYQEPQWYIDFLAFIINKENTNHQPTAVSDVLKNYNSDLPTEEKLTSLKINLITLHRHGLVVYYDSPGLQDTVWLNPEQLVRHLQENLLKKELIKTRGGIINKNEFENDIVTDKKILQLLLEQKIIFLHNPGGQEKDKEYIVPNYLPLANEVDHQYQLLVFGMQQLDFSIKFNDFIPFGFINQLICFYGLQPDVKKFWRNQLLFTLNKEAKVLIQIDFTSLQVKIYIELLPTTNSNKKQVSTYLFYSLIALYWDIWDNNAIINYNKFLAGDGPGNIGTAFRTRWSESKTSGHNKLVKLYEMWQTMLSDKTCVPHDAYLSVDGERFISYRALFDLQGQYRLPAFLLKNGRIDKDSVKEIPVSPFAPFTHKKVAGMKKIFISYSHDDIADRQTLQKYLVNLERDGLIEIWQDGLIQAGDDWDKKIKNSLASADICVLLLSQSFIASNYSHEVEFKAIMEKRKIENTRIIPVLLKD